MLMHKVERNSGPQGLAKKNKEIQDKIKKNVDLDIEIEWGKFKNSKIGKETKEALNEMYLGCCMYCEGSLGVTSHEQIEHFRPKSKFKELCFEYNNLHLACQICNSNKGNKFSENYIDPTVEEPREHINYVGWEAKGKDKKGDTMIETVKLNDSTRIKYRMGSCTCYQDRINVALKAIEGDTKLSDSVKKLISDSLQDIYTAMENGNPYCTMVRDNFKETLDTIMEIVSKKN